MATWLRNLVPALLAAAILTGPVWGAVPVSTGCTQVDEAGSCAKCPQAAEPCCAACTVGEKSCCQPTDSTSSNKDEPSGCGPSCPLGQCDCCQSLHGLTLICLPAGGALSAPRPFSVPVLTAESLLVSRSDEPLLRPPIA